jgi:hypothetical protein
MSDKGHNEEIARLGKLNDDLKKSLRRCREMMHDSEARLAANSNDRHSPAEGQECEEA